MDSAPFQKLFSLWCVQVRFLVVRVVLREGTGGGTRGIHKSPPYLLIYYVRGGVGEARKYADDGITGQIVADLRQQAPSGGHAHRMNDTLTSKKGA